MATNAEKVVQLENALRREVAKLARQRDAVKATEGLIAVIEDQIKALRK